MIAWLTRDFDVKVRVLVIVIIFAWMIGITYMMANQFKRQTLRTDRYFHQLEDHHKEMQKRMDANTQYFTGVLQQMGDQINKNTEAASKATAP